MRFLFPIALVIVLAAGPLGAEPTEEQIAEVEAMEVKLELRKLQLEIESREAELEFQRQMHEVELEKLRSHSGHRRGKHGKGVFLLLWVLVHALATVWVYKDIQQRKTGSGLWIPIVLIGGLLGLLVYAVIRLSDICQMKFQAD